MKKITKILLCSFMICILSVLFAMSASASSADVSQSYRFVTFGEQIETVELYFDLNSERFSITSEEYINISEKDASVYLVRYTGEIPGSDFVVYGETEAGEQSFINFLTFGDGVYYAILPIYSLDGSPYHYYFDASDAVKDSDDKIYILELLNNGMPYEELASITAYPCWYGSAEAFNEYVMHDPLIRIEDEAGKEAESTYNEIIEGSDAKDKFDDAQEQNDELSSENEQLQEKIDEYETIIGEVSVEVDTALKNVQTLDGDISALNDEKLYQYQAMREAEQQYEMQNADKLSPSQVEQMLNEAESEIDKNGDHQSSNLNFFEKLKAFFQGAASFPKSLKEMWQNLMNSISTTFKDLFSGKLFEDFKKLFDDGSWPPGWLVLVVSLVVAGVAILLLIAFAPKILVGILKGIIFVFKMIAKGIAFLFRLIVKGIVALCKGIASLFQGSKKKK